MPQPVHLLAQGEEHQPRLHHSAHDGDARRGVAHGDEPPSGDGGS
jgi:hypothetical protein